MVKDYPPYLDYPKPRRPQTNGDRIRAMTDEELARAKKLTYFRFDGYMVTMLVTKLVTSKTEHFPLYKPHKTHIL